MSEPADFTCEGCGQGMPERERSECHHMPLCNCCYDEHFCVTCAREDHFYDEVDREWAFAKDEAWRDFA